MKNLNLWYSIFDIIYARTKNSPLSSEVGVFCSAYSLGIYEMKIDSPN